MTWEIRGQHFDREDDKVKKLDQEIPEHYPAAKIPEKVAAAMAEGGKSGKDLFELHREALLEAPDLEELVKAEWQKKFDKEFPKGTSLALQVVEDFIKTAKEMEDLRRVVRFAKDPKERNHALDLLTKKEQRMGEVLKGGESFQRAYWEYLASRRDYLLWWQALGKMQILEQQQSEPSYKSLKAEAGLDLKAKSRLESMETGKDKAVLGKPADLEAQLASLARVYPEGSEEYAQLKKELEAEKVCIEAGRARTASKEEIAKELASEKERAKELWADPMVRYFWQRDELENLARDYVAGKDVLELQSTIKNLNTLYEFEVRHPNTTVGGVLVGPPGVGKTTVVRYYLELTGRQYGYIDLSQDVTRYLLFGSKQLEFKTAAEYYKALADDLGRLDEGSFKKFVLENSRVLASTLKLDSEEAIVVYLNQLEKALEQAGDNKLPEDVAGRVKELKEKIVGMANQAFRAELGHQFGTLVKKNGWRDGVVVSLLRQGVCPIFDEFPHFRDWTLLFSLITAKPGERWYFADNNEWIDIPKNWRMYFTGNIGRKHGGSTVAEALASRAEGKVLEVDFPSMGEEMKVAEIALSDPERQFLRSEDDLAKLYYTIFELFPKIREYTKGKNQTISISFRTIRDLAEKLVISHDSKTGQPVFRATTKSFDQALYDVLVGSYALYEDKSTPKEIVSLATATGLFLGEGMKEKIVGWIGEATYETNRKAFAERKKEFNQIVDDMRNKMSLATFATAPETKMF